MDSCIPEQFKAEDYRLAQIWINTGIPVDRVVAENASPAYKRYYEKRKERKRKLKEKGIIVN